MAWRGTPPHLVGLKKLERDLECTTPCGNSEDAMTVVDLFTRVSLAFHVTPGAWDLHLHHVYMPRWSLRGLEHQGVGVRVLALKHEAGTLL